MGFGTQVKYCGVFSRGKLDLTINKDSLRVWRDGTAVKNKDSLTRTRKEASSFPPRSPEHEDFHKTSITSVTVCYLGLRQFFTWYGN